MVYLKGTNNMPSIKTQDSDNYIRQYAKTILSYEDYISTLNVQSPVPKNCSPEQAMTYYLDMLTQPPPPEDARNVLTKLAGLLDNNNHPWPEYVTKYIQSIFPPPIISPFSGTSIVAGYKAVTVVATARWMNMLGYMFTKPPEEWREWELLKLRPYDVQKIKSSLSHLQTCHGAHLQVFCDEDGSLRAPSYNEMIGFLGWITNEEEPDTKYELCHALEGILAFFQENGVYKLIFDGSTVKQWEPDFFRFERPDMIEEQKSVGGRGTVRVVIPAGCAGVGLKNHFPNAAYRVVADQVSPMQGEMNVFRRSGLDNSQLLTVIVAVMNETKGSKSLFNNEVMEKLQKKSKELYDIEATPSSEAFSQARFFRSRLRKISEEAGGSHDVVANFNSWLKDLRAGDY